MEHCHLSEICLPCHLRDWRTHVAILEQYETLSTLSAFETLLAESQRRNWHEDPCIERGSIQQALRSIATLTSTGLSEHAFLHTLLPWIARKAAAMEKSFPVPVPVVASGVDGQLSLTKPQEVCLMSAFLLGHLPLRHWHYRLDSCAQLKLISIILYLCKQYQREQSDSTALQRMPGLTMCRRVLHERKNHDYWAGLDVPLCPLRVEHALLIEDHPEPCWRIDFANEWIGGGVLSGGNVQEELYFSIHPELQLTMLFCQVMLATEVIVVTGAERVADYTGYGHTACFKGMHNDTCSGEHTVVAMDAGVFIGQRYVQYQEHAVLRELNKAYVGFLKDQKEDTRPVVTGNWGCGAFAGDHQFKACLQWMAATAAGRELVYCCFKDRRMEGCDAFVRGMRGRRVAELYRALLEPRVQEQLLRREPLFEVLASSLPPARDLKMEHLPVLYHRPPAWYLQNREDLKVVNLPTTDPEYIAVAAQFHQTSTCQITQILEIQNRIQYTTFAYHHESMSQIERKELEIKRLFHEPGAIKPEAIYQSDTGLDSQVGMWGTGTYFALNSSYSIDSTFAAADGTKEMFLCEVLVGDYIPLAPDNTLAKPPQKPNSSRGYHSVKGNSGGADIWITYEPAMSYTHFLISYR